MNDLSFAPPMDFGSPMSTGSALATIPQSEGGALTTSGDTPVVVDLSSAEKAAVVIAALGPEAAASILSEIGPKRIRRFARVLAGMPEIPAETVDAILAEFLDLLEESRAITGGKDETRRFLSGVMDGEQVTKLMNDLDGDRLSVWTALGDVDDGRIADWLTSEHPQVAAIALSRMPPTKAARVLQKLNNEDAKEIVVRMGRAPAVTEAVALRIGRAIEERFLPSARADESGTNPAELIGSVMNHVPAEVRKQLIEHMAGETPQLADDVQKVMFTFENIIERVKARDVGVVAKAIDETTLLKALKSGGEAGPATTDFFFSNMSKRLSERLREDMDAMEQPSKKEGEGAKAELVAAIVALRDRGDIKMIETDPEEE